MDAYSARRKAAYGFQASTVTVAVTIGYGKAEEREGLCVLRFTTYLLESATSLMMYVVWRLLNEGLLFV